MEVHEATSLSIFFGADPKQFELIGVILGMPLLGAFINGIWGKHLGKSAVRLMALSAIGMSFICSVFTFCILKSGIAHSAQDSREPLKLAWTAWEWMHTDGTKRLTQLSIPIRFSIDPLNSIMMLIVTGIGFLIHLYSTAYMEKDESYWRFFAYLNLFVFSMLVLILADNLPVLFIGWEGVGLCSYLLIGFWYNYLPNVAAGKKAFITNRIGDFGLICAMFLLAHYTGALDWVGISKRAFSLISTAPSHQIHLWPLGGIHYTGFWKFLQPDSPFTISAATAISLCLFLGCTGKSAQIPLYVWLPDAMAGPTPVSALIHAATMVTAGIYLICRLSFVFILSPFTMMLIACVGAATAFFAATIALVQFDIKKVLAYSTVSQLGFMFLGVGVGAFTAGFFHVFTHAFFKACLFLGSGSVIHAMHAYYHNDAQAQDMRLMGGLRRHMPATFWSFTAATAAIIGFPFTAGFFSKDEILYKAFTNHTIHPFKNYLEERGVSVFEPPSWLGPTLYTIGALAATMTAFYMVRALLMTFFGEFRGWQIDGADSTPISSRTESVSTLLHASASSHHDETHEGYPTHAPAPHESPWTMTLPLLLLGAASLFAGTLSMGPFHIQPLEHWLEPLFENAVKRAVYVSEEAEHLEWPLAAGGIGAFAIGTSLAYWMYILKKGEPGKRLFSLFPGLYQLILHKWKIDELYQCTAIAFVKRMASITAIFDQWIVDALLARFSSFIVSSLGALLRTLQTGTIHVYAFAMVLGFFSLSWFFVQPHVDATITHEPNGDCTVQAKSGLGYTYRWYSHRNDRPDTEQYGTESSLTIHLPENIEQSVRLEIRNAFGQQASKDFLLSRKETN
ncbi:NADH-quinone oxidoreductase subunit L [Pajaroellobacter abortibovis]|uniref:NADH-quinone oxidoreductase subunit L n=1 Tax=Pajaroellobacter abortibovis TaxID=1882918 RepID=A0A1L6MXI2_9BACT|nr:NADH-quinone oxidoreductase subunit L [Pajaroellobacter abortibovis]APS00207.1 NADH-quinone oxidoreductase subunit L [Pajaroellobacter abortibovis]